MIEITPGWEIPGLPRWSELRVQGDSLDPTLAAGLIVRAGRAAFSEYACNDRAWCRLVMDTVDWPVGFDEEEYREISRLREIRAEELGLLPLGALSLSGRIASSYIGGPGGWLSWSGRIQTAGHNIGKYPSVQDVAQEWSCLTEAYTELKLTAQLFSEEGTEPGGIPLAEFQVVDGKVTVGPPGDPLPPGMRDLMQELVGMNNPYRERGCTGSMLKAGVEAALSRLSGR
jgi:hypothetical protein